jgi:gas vesicle protein
MFPFGLAIGFVAGAAGAMLFAPQIAEHARPVAKAALKAALAALHEAQLRGAEMAEAAEDLYAEAKAEVNAEMSATASAAGEVEAEAEGVEPEEATAETPGAERPPSAAA